MLVCVDNPINKGAPECDVSASVLNYQRPNSVAFRKICAHDRVGVKSGIDNDVVGIDAL